MPGLSIQDKVYLCKSSAKIQKLFQTTKNNITLHIRNIFKEGELEESSVCKESLLNAADGKRYKTKFYSLDVIISRTFRQSVNRHNRQYAPIDVRTANRIHDRFLIIDETLYHIGASIKDLGKKLFAFSKLEISPDYILANI